MSTIDFTETPEAEAPTVAGTGSASDKYRLAVINAATSGHMVIDESLLRGTNRFELDFRNDVDKMAKRFRAAEAIEAADVELARLEQNPPQPRPAADWPLSQFKTLGELATAIYVIQHPTGVIWQPEESHRLATANAKAARARAVNTLRSSADPNLHAEIGQLNNAIARHRTEVAKYAELKAELASLEKVVAAGYRTEEERDIWHEKRRELKQMRIKVADTPASLDEAEVRQKIEALAEKQLLPLSVDFQPPQPAGHPAGIGGW